MLLRRLGPRDIDDLSDAMEERISEKIIVDFRYEMALIESDMIGELISAIGGVTWHVGTKYGYEEVAENFEVVRLSGEDKIDHVKRPMGNRAGQFDIS